MIKGGYCPRIGSIQIYLAGNEDIKNLGVIKVRSHESFQTGETPIQGGMYDPRMGAIGVYYQCITCGNSKDECPGHFGYYEIDTQIIQPLAVEDVIKWLKIVCLKCGTLLIDPDKFKTKGNKRLQVAAQSQLSEKRCPKCDTVHPKIKPSEDNIFYITAQSDISSKTLKPQDIKQIFDKISDETVIAMGRSLETHPNKYYIDSIPIPPISIRPYYRSALTNKSHRTTPTLDFLKHIIRRAKVKSIVGADKIDEKNLFLNRCYDDMVRGRSQKRGENRTNNIIGGPLSDAIMKSVGGKKGLIRNYQMGHRSLNGSRITISGNPRLEVDQLGIPLYVVRTLQIGETVREWNYERLKAEILVGNCTRIKRIRTGHEHGLGKKNDMDIALEYGDIIYRNVRDGDMVFFNRPPSIKESAIGAHRAVTFKYESENTFQMNVAACANYNADFDGDQMRLKVPRTLRAIVEAEYISTLTRMMLSSQHANSVNGQVQDSCVGSFLMTKDGVEFDKLHAMRLWTTTGLIPPVFDKKLYTGRDIVTMLLHDTPITYTGKPKYYQENMRSYIPYKENEIKILIENGVHKSGILDKAAVGSGSSSSIFHLIALEFGTKTAMKKLFSYQQIVLKFLEMRGFTMAFDDLIIPKSTRDVISRIVNEQEQKSQLLTDEMTRGETYPPMGMTIHEFYEQQQIAKLQVDQSIFGPIFSSIDQENNGLFQMIMSGSKGATTNLQAIFGYIGQMTQDGSRMPLTFSPFRAGAYFPRFDISPASRGFVKNCLVEGINPHMAPFTSQEARQQVVTKSQSTAIGGSQMRKHIKNLENTIVNYFGQTIKSYMLIQFLYGEDGIDPRYLVKQKLTTIMLSNTEIREKYIARTNNKSLKSIFDDEYTRLIADRDKYRIIAMRLAATGLKNGFETSLMFSVHLSSIIQRHSRSKPSSDKELAEMVQMIDKYTKDFVYLYLNNIQREQQSPVPEYLSSATFAITMLLRSSLSSGNSLQKMNKRLLKFLLDEVSLKFISSLMPPGSAVGVMAGQSVGEPMTQAMLDAIHGASSGSKAGIEKTKEIIGAKQASNESNTIWFKLIPEVGTDKQKTDNVSENIKSVMIKDLRPSWQIFLEDYGAPVHSAYKHEAEMIKDFEKRNPIMARQHNNLSRWLIRIQLDKTIMILKSITVERIVQALYLMSKDIFIAHTTELDAQVILRIYIRETALLRENNPFKFIKQVMLNNILECMIRGVSNIIDTMIQPVSTYKQEDDGSLVSFTEHIIRTIGFNMEGLILVADKLGIDKTNIHLGSVMDTFEYYGIEAARTRMIEQIVANMEGKDPNYHHLSIYGDVLTWTGTVRPIGKAIDIEKNNTLPVASGYAASKALQTTAMIGATESTNSIATPVMLGSIPRIGTNYSSLLVNEKFVRENTKSLTDTILDL